MLSPVRVEAPNELPVSMEEAKAHLRVDHDDDDLLIEALIAAATDHFDGRSGMLGRAIVRQRWRVGLREWPAAGRVWLPLGDVLGVVEITYVDPANETQTLDRAGYLGPFTNLSGFWIEPTANRPSLASRPDAITVEWEAGFGAAADVPAAIKQAILLLVGQWYETRENVSLKDAGYALPFAAEALISPYRKGVV